MFSQQFVKTNEVTQEYGKMLARQQKLREEADYATDSSFSPEDVAAALEDAGKFGELAYQFLRQKGSESVTNCHRLKMEAPGEETKTDKVKIRH